MVLKILRVDWIDLDQSLVRWRAYVKTVLDTLGSAKREPFLN